jgi:hypothetical protein
MKENRKRPASTTRSHALMYLRVKNKKIENEGAAKDASRGPTEAR